MHLDSSFKVKRTTIHARSVTARWIDVEGISDSFRQPSPPLQEGACRDEAPPESCETKSAPASAPAPAADSVSASAPSTCSGRWLAPSPNHSDAVRVSEGGLGAAIESERRQ